MKLIIKADNLIDGTGAKSLSQGALVIERGRITEVTTQQSLSEYPEDFEVFEVLGGTIMPGFVETHSHMHCSGDANAYYQVTTETDDVLLTRAIQAVRTSLVSGVTTMRDLGSKNRVAFAVKRDISSGLIPGPRLLVSGTPITTMNGHCNSFGSEANTDYEVVRAVRNQINLGADCVKIMSTGGNFTPGTNVRAPQYPVETLVSAVREADRFDVPVAAHCHATIGVRSCVMAAVQNLVHCSWIASDPSNMYDYDVEISDTIADNGSFVDPTVAIGIIRAERDPKSKEFLPGGALSELNARYAILRDMLDRGSRFVAGSDSGMPHVRFSDYAYVPIAFVNELGMSNMDAIVCCTRNSADCLGVLSETGTLEPGKMADVVVVDGNPLVNIEAMRHVSAVVKSGAIVKRGGRVMV